MNLNRYELNASEDYRHYGFVSEGINGRIPKRISFEPLSSGIYNLAFGDVDPTTGTIDDLAISNNGDSNKVLTTVASAIYAFLAEYPDACIFAVGSTSSRTRLYQMGISRNYGVWNEVLAVSGLKSDDWCPFERGESYAAFLIRLKKA